MIVIAVWLSLLGFVFKPVSWLAGDSRLRQTFSLRIHLVERQSLSSICPSTIISYLRSLEASLTTSASRPIAGPIVFSFDRNKPVTQVQLHYWDYYAILDALPGTISAARIQIRESKETMEDTTLNNSCFVSPTQLILLAPISPYPPPVVATHLHQNACQSTHHLS